MTWAESFAGQAPAVIEKLRLIIMQSVNGFYTLSHLVLFRQYYADGGFAYGFWDASLRYDAVLVE